MIDLAESSLTGVVSEIVSDRIMGVRANNLIYFVKRTDSGVVCERLSLKGEGISLRAWIEANEEPMDSSRHW